MTTYRNPSLFHQYRFSLHAQALLQVAFLSAHMLFRYAWLTPVHCIFNDLLYFRNIINWIFLVAWLEIKDFSIATVERAAASENLTA